MQRALLRAGLASMQSMAQAGCSAARGRAGRARAGLQVARDVGQEHAQRLLADEEVVQREHAGDGVKLALLAPHGRAERGRGDKLRVQRRTWPALGRVRKYLMDLSTGPCACGALPSFTAYICTCECSPFSLSTTSAACPSHLQPRPFEVKFSSTASAALPLGTCCSGQAGREASTLPAQQRTLARKAPLRLLDLPRRQVDALHVLNLRRVGRGLSAGRRRGTLVLCCRG